MRGIVDHRVEELKKKKSEWDSKMKQEGDKTDEREPSMLRVDSVPDDLVENISLYGCAQVAPFNSFWGGIVAQEVVKYTGKFTPLNQWVHYSNFKNCLPDGEVTRVNDPSDRFRDQTVIFGTEAIQKLKGLKLLMIGAGALGCEYLKQFALMGVSSEGDGHLTVTDDDTIEISNLNRQFLFRRTHVSKSKAEVSCGVAKTINSKLNVNPMKYRVGPSTEEIFTDVFWDNLDCVFGAVDNVKARQYVDSKCVLHNKHLIEAGTLGTKCNSQMIIPFKTQSYSDSQDPAEKSIPMCTLRNYPYLLDHCIERARDVFHGFFCDGTNDFATLVKDPKKFVDAELKEAGNMAGGVKDKFSFLHKLSAAWPLRDVQSFVNVARQVYQDNFYDELSQLLYCFPVDFKDDNGRIFWSAPKRAPHVIEFDASDEMSFLFIKSIVTILSGAFHVKEKFTDEQIREALKTAQFQVVEPGNKKIKKDDNDQVDETGDDDDQVIQQLANKLRAIQADPNFTVNPVEFEKDDDSNGHIDFMAAFSNLRGRNYTIEEAPRYKIKLIAGKIIPAIATTTAMIVGACGMELYKLVLGKPHTAFRNSFCTLALPNWVFSETMDPIVHEDKELDPILYMPVVAIPPKWTSWESIDIQGPKTVAEMNKELMDRYQIEVSMVISGTTTLWNGMMDSNKSRLDVEIKELYIKIHKDAADHFYEGKKYLVFVVGAEKDGVDADCPIIRYILN